MWWRAFVHLFSLIICCSFLQGGVGEGGLESFLWGRGCWAPWFSRRINDWEMESFLLRLHGRRVSKDGMMKFYGSSLRMWLSLSNPYIGCWSQENKAFSQQVWYRIHGCHQGGLLCLGGYLEESYNFRSHSKESVVLANRCFLCLKEEESWITFYFIVLKQEFYGIFCSPFLVCRGCSPY